MPSIAAEFISEKVHTKRMAVHESPEGAKVVVKARKLAQEAQQVVINAFRASGMNDGKLKKIVHSLQAAITDLDTY